MAMKTKVTKMGDTVVVTLDGRLDYEMQEPLKNDLNKLIRQTKAAGIPHGSDASPRKIIFNLENLQFVGSSGISSFIQTLKEFNLRAPSKPRYCNVASEFKKIIKAFDEEAQFEFFESEERARKSFEN